jgi:hypothetical protein
MVWRNCSWRLRRYRLCAGVALVCYLATAVGFPVPSLPFKEHSQPFPCQDHPCGCQTAEQCWRHCCCFSPEERFAWAESHHVQPPAYAERPANHGWSTARDQMGACEEKNVCSLCTSRETCSTPVHKICCTNHRDATPCCSKESGPLAERSRPESATRTSWMLGIAALRCQGITTMWVSVGAVVPPPASLAGHDQLLPTGWLTHRNASPLPLILTPPDPPPRLTSA